MSAYFHEDWDYEYATWEAAVDDFVRRSPELAALAPSDIDSLLAQRMDATQLRKALLELGSAHNPLAFGTSHQDWLIQVRDRLRMALERGRT